MLESRKNTSGSQENREKGPVVVPLLQLSPFTVGSSIA